MGAEEISPMVNEQKQRAKQLLVHYFRVVYERNGWRFDADYAAELEDIVDAIVDAAGVHTAGMVNKISELEDAVADVTAALEKAERLLTLVTKGLDLMQVQHEQLEEKVDQPDWRQRR
jgi:hypothetical protein